MKEFSHDEQVRFWTAHTESFKGDSVSRVILCLARKALGRRALDIGAGSGALMRQYRRLRPDVEIAGIDLAPKGAEVEQGDCTSLRFAEASLDTVTCTDVIEHLSDADLARCLAEVRRVLATGGHAIFSTINEERLEDSVSTCPECGCRFHHWGHCQVFTEARLRGLLAQYGLDVVRVVKTHLGLRASHPRLAGLFFALRLERVLKVASLTRDIVVVARAR